MTIVQPPAKRQIAWNVYLKGRLIDTVFYDPTCSQQYVREGLINHDGYDARIVVTRAR